MVIHTFGFRWKPGVTAEQRAESIKVIRAMQGEIPGLLNTWVGENISPRSQGYELGGVMQFTDRAALDAYGSHPAHQKVLAFLRPLIEAIEIDFEV
jgi:stress responsive alpha/beta barrel protein